MWLPPQAPSGGFVLVWVLRARGFGAPAMRRCSLKSNVEQWVTDNTNMQNMFLHCSVLPRPACYIAARVQNTTFCIAEFCAT